MEQYIKTLENGLMNALDEISVLSKKVNKDFDYYDKLVELTDMCNSDALDFLDKFGDEE